jgi:hypothetical protein
MSGFGSCDDLVDPSNSDVLGCVFGYVPNTAAAGIFLVVFLLLLALHSWLALRFRHVFCLYLLVACIGEAAGFIVRLILIHSFSTNAYIAMTVLLIISPNLLALLNYALLKRIIAAIMGPAVMAEIAARPRQRLILSLLQPTSADGRISPVFVDRLFHVLVLAAAIVQVVGVSDLTSSDSGDQTTGQHLLVVGLAVILFTFACFAVIALHVLFSPRYELSGGSGLPAVRALYISMLHALALLTVRTTYRLVEYSTGIEGWVAQHEALFYILDSLMMAACLLNFAILYCGHWLPKAEEELMHRRQQREFEIKTAAVMQQV